MAFDFAAEEKDCQQDLVVPQVQACILGSSGSGKSSLMGTFGVKTLYLYGGGEEHGPAAARTLGGPHVVPVNWDYARDPETKKRVKLAPGAALDRILAAITDLDGIKAAGFGAIVLDGLTELEQLIRGTKKWEQLCLTDKGKHNNFAEGDAVKACARPILDGLRNASRVLGLHFAVSLTLDVRSMSDTGEVLESSPRLSTYSVAEGLLQQFRDYFVVGRMAKGDKVAHRIQFLAGVSKTSKDATGIVKKAINFTPRITGISADKLPNTFDADLAALAKFKKENVK